ncbi:MAG: hypothetical protein V1735_04050 [Nanoarchaeota archaeon]
MALLNIKKKDQSEHEDVPDSLPSLAEQQPAAQPAPVAQPMEVKVELAPDELPPLIQRKEEPKPVAERPVVKVAAEPPPADEHLFFSKLMERFSKADIEDIPDRVSGQDVMRIISENYSKDRQLADVQDANKRAVELIKPLQAKEQQWRSLRAEIEAYEKALSEKKARIITLEADIRRSADEVAALMGSREAIAQLLRN